MLEAHELSEILQPITEVLARPIDLVGLDMGVAAFVEIAYQIQGLAGILVASQRPLPDAGWPYDKMDLAAGKSGVSVPKPGAEDLAKLIVDTVADEYARIRPTTCGW